MNKAFLDTSYAIALAADGDEYHSRALVLADQFEADQRCLVTTRAVLLEIGNALSKRRFRTLGAKLLESLEFDSHVEIVELTAQLYDQALALFVDRPDKEWGLVDCVSFVVMQELELTDALTADEHFEQAGFRALLRNA